MIYAVVISICGIIILPSFMKTVTVFRAILKFCVIKFEYCNVGITDGIKLWNVSLRWDQVA
jgi:hypothetical protein